MTIFRQSWPAKMHELIKAVLLRTEPGLSKYFCQAWTVREHSLLFHPSNNITRCAVHKFETFIKGSFVTAYGCSFTLKLELFLFSNYLFRLSFQSFSLAAPLCRLCFYVTNSTWVPGRSGKTCNLIQTLFDCENQQQYENGTKQSERKEKQQSKTHQNP